MDSIVEFFEEPWARAVTAVAVSILVAFFVHRYVLRGLLMLTARTRTDVDDKVVAFLRFPLVISTVLIGFSVAIAYLQWTGPLRFVSSSILKTIALWVWVGAAFKGTSRIISALAQRPGIAPWLQTRTIPLFDIGAKVIIVATGIYFIFLAWRINVTAWMASAGVIGIAVGFAAKDTLANLFAGVFILADAPYKLGDTIVLDTGTRGLVTDIGIRSTRILTRDQVEVTVPNALIANGIIINESGGPGIKTRIKLPVGVAYGTDVDQVRTILLNCAKNVDHVCTAPAPVVRFMEMGDSALGFHLVVFIDKPPNRDCVIDALNTRVYNALNAAGIEIPFPQRDVHITPLLSTTRCSTEPLSGDHAETQAMPGDGSSA